MILTECVYVKITARNYEHYKKFLGEDIQKGQSYLVKPEQLTSKSAIIIKVKCDYCGNEFERPWYSILRGWKYIKKDTCLNCTHKKQEETNMKVYGCKSSLMNKEVQKKTENTLLEKYGAKTFMGSKRGQEIVSKTMMERYGVEKPFQNKQIKERAVQTITERFGEKGPLGNKEIRKRIIETNQEKYGVDNPMKKEEIKQRMYDSNMEKYGVPYQFVADDFREKRGKTCIKRYDNQKIGVSTQQIELSKYYKCIINQVIGRYYADLYFPESKTIIEYDGGGHNLSVKIGQLSEEEFQEKEQKRLNYLLESGYKVGRIYNPDDRVINREKALEIKNKIFRELETKNYFVFNV